MFFAVFNPYKGMKNFNLLVWLCQTAAALFYGAGLFAADVSSADIQSANIQSDETPAVETAVSDEKEMKPKLTAKEFFKLFGWSILWSGSWEEGAHIVPSDEAASGKNDSSEPADKFKLFGALQNRGEVKITYLPLGLTLRGQVLDRRKMVLENKPPWSDPETRVTNYMGGLYHKQTGSRLLYGVLDEWGLPARIRNPWIRSPPYAENHKPIIADLKTSPNSTKEDELYLYLSTPNFSLPSDVKLRGFISMQHEIKTDTETEKEFTPAVSGGLDISFLKNYSLSIEGFYYGKNLPPLKVNKWFSYPPPLPEREFDIFAGAVIFSSPDVSVSTDFAISKTFAWAVDFYANLGISISPLIPSIKQNSNNQNSNKQKSSSITRPLLISLAADYSGERFVNRDGTILKEGFRTAFKIEWKSRYSSLLRLNSVLRFSGFGDDLCHISAGIYYRFPSSARDTAQLKKQAVFRMTRVSFNMSRNSENPLKITDSYSADIGFRIKNLFTVNLAGGFKGLETPGDTGHDWNWTAASVSFELNWSPKIKKKTVNFQLTPGAECNIFPEKKEIWEISLNSSIRFKYGRISFKVISPDFPNKWQWTLSWRCNFQ